MCGRFVIAKEISAVADLFEVENYPSDQKLINYTLTFTYAFDERSLVR